MPAKGKFSIVILDSSMQCFLTCPWFPQHNSAKFPTPLIATLLQVATSTGTSFVFSLLVNPQHFVSSFSQKMTSKQYICQEKKRKKKKKEKNHFYYISFHSMKELFNPTICCQQLVTQVILWVLMPSPRAKPGTQKSI